MSQQTKDSIIRDYLAKFPNMGPTEMTAKILAERRDVVKKLKPQEISTVKSKVRGQNKGVTIKPPSTSPVAESNGLQDQLPTFVAVTRVVKQVGWERAREILEAVRE